MSTGKATTHSKGFNALPNAVSVFEVGPRDGLQSESKILTTAEKTTLILKLIEAGLPDIEVGSFVRADRIPQLADTPQVIRELRARAANSRSRFWAFIPNDRGLSLAIENQIDGASFFIAASNTFCLKNVNRTQGQLLAELAPLLAKAKANGLKSRVYLSTLVYCPYEGDTDPARVESLVDQLLERGATEIALSDTTGHANPLSTRRVLEPLLAKHPASAFALHLHDTRGLALANILEAMNLGLARFDSSIAGTGGCPYAPGASGNLSTEDLVYMLQSMGLDRSIDLAKLGEAGLLAETLFGRRLPSRVLRTLEKTSGEGSEVK